jgi:hypothetical protein
MKIAPLLLVSALATTFASLSNASSLLVNGSFEDTYSTGAGVTALPGWTVSSGNIDLGSFGPSTPDGLNAIDLTGSYGGGAGAIYQDFETVAGSSYSLSFYFGANPQWQYADYANDSPIKSMSVLLDGVELRLFSKDTTGWAIDYFGWEQIALTFTATNNSTRLTFQSLNGANGTVFGPALDGVVVTDATVSEVPVPGTLGLLGIGLAALGFVRRKPKP